MASITSRFFRMECFRQISCFLWGGGGRAWYSNDLFPVNGCCDSSFLFVYSGYVQSLSKRPNVECFHTRAKCTIRMIVWVTCHSNAGILIGLCVRKLASWRVIWISQFKWWSGGVFKWRMSQITRRNRRMNALTSKLWFGGRSYVTF